MEEPRILGQVPFWNAIRNQIGKPTFYTPYTQLRTLFRELHAIYREMNTEQPRAFENQPLNRLTFSRTSRKGVMYLAMKDYLLAHAPDVYASDDSGVEEELIEDEVEEEEEELHEREEVDIKEDVPLAVVPLPPESSDPLTSLKRKRLYLWTAIEESALQSQTLDIVTTYIIDASVDYPCFIAWHSTCRNARKNMLTGSMPRYLQRRHDAIVERLCVDYDGDLLEALRRHLYVQFAVSLLREFRETIATFGATLKANTAGLLLGRYDAWPTLGSATRSLHTYHEVMSPMAFDRHIDILLLWGRVMACHHWHGRLFIIDSAGERKCFESPFTSYQDAGVQVTTDVGACMYIEIIPCCMVRK